MRYIPIIKLIPIISVSHPLYMSIIAILNNKTLAKVLSFPFQYPITEVLNAYTPMSAVRSAIATAKILLPWRSKSGEYTNMKGTKNPAEPNLSALQLTAVGLEPEIPAAVYDASATGGVILDKLAK